MQTAGQEPTMTSTCSPLDLRLGDVIADAHGCPWEVTGLDRETSPHGRRSVLTHVTARPLAPTPGGSTRPVTWRGWAPNVAVPVLAHGGQVAA